MFVSCSKVLGQGENFREDINRSTTQVVKVTSDLVVNMMSIRVDHTPIKMKKVTKDFSGLLM